jgi:hypothetical protein
MSTYRNMRIPRIPLGVGGREDGVDQDEGANDLSAKTIALGVAIGNYVGTTTVAHVKPLLEALNDSSSTDCPKALHDYVEDGPRQGQLPGQEQPKGHCWVDVPSC